MSTEGRAKALLTSTGRSSRLTCRLRPRRASWAASRGPPESRRRSRRGARQRLKDRREVLFGGGDADRAEDDAPDDPGAVDEKLGGQPEDLVAMEDRRRAVEADGVTEAVRLGIGADVVGRRFLD